MRYLRVIWLAHMRAWCVPPPFPHSHPPRRRHKAGHWSYPGLHRTRAERPSSPAARRDSSSPPTHTSVPPIQMERGRKIEELAEEDRKYVSDAYKREVVEAMSTSQV